MPLCAHFDTAPAIVLVRFMAFVLTTKVHHVPDAVFLVVDGLDGLTFASTVRLRVSWTNEVIRGYSLTNSAYAFDSDSLDEVSGPCLLVVGHSLNDGEEAKLVSCRYGRERVAHFRR